MRYGEAEGRPAVQEPEGPHRGSRLFVEENFDDPLYGATSFVSVLSLPMVLDQLVPKLSKAVDGDPATIAQPRQPGKNPRPRRRLAVTSEEGVSVMEWLAVLFVFALLCALLNAVLPHPPARWRRRLQPSVERLTGRFRRRAEPEPDPFDTLRLQTRLGYLAGKIRRVEATPRMYAKAHKLMALEAAYDDLLDEACRLAGIPAETDLERGEEKRWLEEQALAARGWSW